MNTFKRLIPLLYLLTGCSETAVQLHIQPAPTAGGLDSICLQLAARNSFQFGRRYLIGGSTEELTFTVIAGESSSFEVLLTGRRRGQNVAQLRRRIAFESGAISDEPLVLAECGGTASSGTFSWVQRLTDQPGAAAAGVPSPFSPSQAVVAWPGEARRFAQIEGSVKQVQGGLPALPGGAVRRVINFDMDNDCDEDLLILAESGPQLWAQQPDGTFLPHNGALPGGDFLDGAVADFNRDGYSDLALLSSQDVEILLNSGAGSFRVTEAFIGAITDGTALAVAYLGASGGEDRLPDLVVARGGTADREGMLLINRFNGGVLQFQKALFGQAMSTLSAATLDLNHDGVSEVVVGLAGGGVKLFRNTGVGDDVDLQEVPGVVPDEGDGVEMILARDLDGDCDEDLIFARRSSTLVLTNQGGTFSVQAGTDLYPKGTRVATVDVNGDSLLDLVVAGESDGASWLRQEP